MNDPVQMKKVLSFLGDCCEGEKSGKRRILHGECSKGRECMSGDHQRRCIRKHEKVIDKCSFYEVPIYTLGTKEMLGKAIGKEMRASLAVTDPVFRQHHETSADNSGMIQIAFGVHLE